MYNFLKPITLCSSITSQNYTLESNINPHCKRSKTHKHCLRLITLYFSNVEKQYLFLFNMVINCTSALHVELNPVLLIVFTLNSVNILKFGRTFEAVSDQLFPSSGQYHPSNARSYEPPLLKEDKIFLVIIQNSLMQINLFVTFAIYNKNIILPFLFISLKS